MRLFSLNKFTEVINLLEPVQRRVTKMMRGMDNFSYKDRLRKLGFSLENRRLQGDLIATF